MADGDNFISIDSARFEAFLQAMGFTRTVHCREVVYVKRHERCPVLSIKIFTTISGEPLIEGSKKHARDLGKDSIKIGAVFDNGQRVFGLERFMRVYRTASASLSDEEKEKAVFARVHEKAREAYQKCNEWAKSEKAKGRSWRA